MSVPCHEGWIDRQIREAIERGEFDDLPGAGKPLRGLDDRDPDWWVKRMMEREGLDSSDALPPVFQLRREHATFPDSLADVATEEGVREILRDYNERVLAELRRPTFGPASPPIAPRADVEVLVEQWRRLRAQRAEAPADEGAPEPPSPPSHRRSWWRRLRRR
ncbi:DUF1992 domain-containing protein [Janibacter cremeus]|uniref:DnaJ family domain-containing protein n=1 Tax=Janibacter cremeus TaxID=1285192 RepID=UPI0023F654D3|nr:DnaJ family domain-containing protein [Janibacter cremeus]WEV76638.1 DUF1992 domain-containing protein [Janibacter cremeus]